MLRLYTAFDGGPATRHRDGVVAGADPKERFSSRAEVYARWRPDYPESVLKLLRQAIGLDPAWVVADIGSGTGISSRLFLEQGHEVFGVEPNAAMRREAERFLAQFPRFHSVDGSAEATMLPDAAVDLIVAGQAFHWFDREAARREFVRILRPGGLAVLIWNTRRKSGSPFAEGYERLLRNHGTDYGRVRHENTSPAALRAFFGGDFGQATLEHRQVLDRDGLRGRLLSTSYVPFLGEPGHEAMISDLETLFADCQREGRIVMTYDTEVHWGRIGSFADGQMRRRID
jgi:SAM-dependent methyltransferase